jgi:hypothetical protein
VRAENAFGKIKVEFTECGIIYIFYLYLKALGIPKLSIPKLYLSYHAVINYFGMGSFLFFLPPESLPY